MTLNALSARAQDLRLASAVSLDLSHDGPVDALARAWWACALLGSALASLTWCSVSYVRANPNRRLPGKLPDAVHPPGYMGVGIFGITCAVLGGLAVAGTAGGVMWLVAGAVIGAGLLPTQLLHNRRLRR